MKHQRPKDGWPWERPGHQFYTDKMREWLGGYEPQFGKPTPRGYNASQAASASRDKGLAEGKSWATGYIAGMSMPSDPGKAIRMLKSSKLG